MSYIDGVSQAGPVGGVVAEPMHSGMISPVNVPSNPVNSNAPRPFEFWTLKGADVRVRFTEVTFRSSCTATHLSNFAQLSDLDFSYCEILGLHWEDTNPTCRREAVQELSDSSAAW